MENQTKALKASTDYVSLIKDNLDPKKYFKKKKYESYFEEYCKNSAPVFQKLKEALQDSDEEAAMLHITQITQEMAQFAKEDIETCGSFAKRNRLAELNLFLVTSVFPCNLRLGGDYGTMLCDKLVEAWENAFPGTKLGYTTFEKLNENFRSFFSFFTSK